MKSTNFDAIIVLANLMDARGVLNNESKARALEAVRIFNSNSSKCLVTCGWNYRTDTAIKIADSLKKYITKELGIRCDLVSTELNSRDTVGDAYFTKINFAKPLFWKNLCVVTSNYHAPRAEKIFNFIYGAQFNIKVYGAVVDVNSNALTNENSSMNSFMETFSDIQSGDDENILRALRERHPFYNGEIYKKI